MELDEALNRLGRFGKWQVRSYLLTATALSITAAWHMIAIVYIGYIPEHHCNVVDLDSVPRLADGKPSQCNIYIDKYSGNDTRECSDWKFLAYDGETTVTQMYTSGAILENIRVKSTFLTCQFVQIAPTWNLVCSREYLKDFSQTILVVGTIFGAMGFTALADRFGRKPIFFFSMWAMIVVGTINALVTNYIAFIVLRFFTGALQQGVGLVGFVLSIELFSAKYRTFTGIMINNLWAVAWCILPLVSYILPDWHHFQLFISLIGVMSIPLFWVISESVIWLCANDRQDEAEVILRKAAKMNNVEMPEYILSSVNREPDTKANGEQETKQEGGGILAKFKKLKRVKKEKTAGEPDMVYTLIDVFRNRKLSIYAIVMSLLWMVNTLVYYGLSLSTATLAGDRLVNAFLNALIEIPAYSSSYFVINKWGRKHPLIIYHCIAGLSLIMMEIIPSKAGDVSLLPLIITLNMIGKFGITGSFGIVFLYATEIFPTTLRSQAMGISSVLGRAGNIIATYAPFVFVHVPWLPAPLFGGMSILVGMLVFLLPETLNRPLPQTIEDIENWSKTPPPSAAKGQPKDPILEPEMNNASNVV